MALSNGKQSKTIASKNDVPPQSWRIQLASELFEGRYKPGQRVELREIGTKYKVDDEALLKAFAEFQALGMVTLSGNFSAIIHSPNPKEMQEAYELRAAVEEIAGRTAALALKGNSAGLEKELEAMRAAVARGDLDAYVEHDVKFHKSILKASANEVLLRVWETLLFDLRIRAAIGKVAKDVQQAFFPPQSFSIPCLSCETFYQPARGIGGDYYDFLSLPEGRWGIAI